MKSKHDEIRKEQLATEVLALVDRFHTPATDDHRRHDATRPFARLAVPVALEGLALLSFAQVLPPGVYVAMNGQYFAWDRVRKNRESGIFEATP